MAAKNDITNDSIISRPLSKLYDENYDSIFTQSLSVIEDEFGNQFEKCGKRCWVEIIDGNLQCNKPNCEKDFTIIKFGV